MDLLVAVAAVFAAQVVKGVTGFGGALVAVPVFAWLWGPVEAVLMVGAVDWFGGLVLLPRVWRQLHPGLLAALFLPLVAGQALGTRLLTWLPEATVAGAMGAMVAAFALSMLWRPVRAGWGEHDALPSPASAVLVQGAGAAALGGLLAGLVGAGGPPIIVHARRWFTDTFGRAQLIGVFWLGATSLVLQLLARGADPGVLAERLPWLLLPLVIGSATGQWLAGRLSREAFGRIVGVVLLGSGLGLLVRSLG